MQRRGGQGASSGGSLGAAFTEPSSDAALVWRRFRRERLGFAALIGLVAIVLACFLGEPLLAGLLGHSADPFFARAVDVNLTPAPPWSWIPDQSLDGSARHGRTLFVLGADGPLGRDEFLRLL